MFRGTKAYPPEKYQAILTKAGARQNAYTTDDYTNYHTTFAKEDLEKVLEIEADRFQNLDYPEEAFKTESRAVLGEYNKNSANPMSKLFEAMRDTAFTTHTYKHTTMGFLKDIEDMPNQFAYSKAFFDRWYRPEYATVIVAGDVDPAKVLPLVEKYWGGWKRGSYKRRDPRGAGADGGRRRSTSPGRRRRSPGSSSPSTAPRSRRRRRTGRRSTSSSTSPSARPPTSTRSSSRPSRRSTSSSRTCPPAPTRSSSRSARA